MPLVNDQTYLQSQQYRDASNLNARVALHARFSLNKQPWQQWVFDRLRLPERCAILELGCGPGNLWSENAQRLPPSWRLTLTDFSPGMIAQARQNLAQLEQRGQSVLLVADAQHIPCADGVFDAVIANHMLYHVPDRRQTLAEARRALQPGGRLYAATVGAAHMRELDDLVMRFDPLLAQTGIGLGKPYTPFSLQNGRAQLAALFAHVELHRYADALHATEVGPLVDYIQSGTDKLPEDRLAELTLFVQHELQKNGAIHITKDSGLFVAW